MRRCRRVLDHHGHALRLRAVAAAGGRMDACEIAPPGAWSRRTVCGGWTLAGLTQRRCVTALSKRRRGAASSRLSPGSGVMLQAVWFNGGPQAA